MALTHTGFRSWVAPSLVAALLVAGCAASKPHAKVAAPPTVSKAIASAVADPARPAADVERDADRKPAQTLAFFDVKPGQVVFEFVAGGGYFTELLSHTVGPAGHVTATRVAKERIADNRLANVTAVEDNVWGLTPSSVDLAFTALNYHDVVNLKIGRGPLLANILTILKPGGIFAVIDHSAQGGSGARDVGTLHRIDEAQVVEEVKAAGFELIGTSDLLRNSNDTRTLAVFDPSIRGKTDQFVLKFRKPLAH